MDRCLGNLYFYYDEPSDIIKISHCCQDRISNIIGELSSSEFYQMSEDAFYSYLNSIVFTKPIICPFGGGACCEHFWKEVNYEIKIVVAISRQCNLSCPMCYARLGGHKDSSKRKLLYLDLLRKLKNFKFKSIMLTDWGEPLVYIEEVLPMLTTYKYCNRLEMFSNGTLLTRELVDRILSIMDEFHLTIDCDSLNKTRYEQIRVGAVFEDFMSRLMDMISLYKDKTYGDRFELQLTAVLTDINPLDGDSFFEFCTKHSVPHFIQYIWNPSIEYSY